MAPKKEWAPAGSYPVNARTALDIQSKAVLKDKHLLVKAERYLPGFALCSVTGEETNTEYAAFVYPVERLKDNEFLEAIISKALGKGVRVL